ncbi:hypothetical protein ACGF0D_35255 [Kitasatospora sp. NPDC048298]|uniref:hypothetical protein n=1 Tax=Kitasatospora sp. NPDC048298 TaxID=3364049 RepID=UPI00371CE01F
MAEVVRVVDRGFARAGDERRQVHQVRFGRTAVVDGRGQGASQRDLLLHAGGLRDDQSGIQTVPPHQGEARPPTAVDDLQEFTHAVADLCEVYLGSAERGSAGGQLVRAQYCLCQAYQLVPQCEAGRQVGQVRLTGHGFHSARARLRRRARSHLRTHAYGRGGAVPRQAAAEPVQQPRHRAAP